MNNPIFKVFKKLNFNSKFFTSINLCKFLGKHSKHSKFYSFNSEIYLNKEKSILNLKHTQIIQALNLHSSINSNSFGLANKKFSNSFIVTVFIQSLSNSFYQLPLCLKLKSLTQNVLSNLKSSFTQLKPRKCIFNKFNS